MELSRPHPRRRFARRSVLVTTAIALALTAAACGSDSESGAPSGVVTDAVTGNLPANSCTVTKCNVYSGVDLSAYKGVTVGILNIAPIPSPWRFSKNLEKCITDNGGKVNYVDVGGDFTKTPGILQGWISSDVKAIFSTGVPLGNQSTIMQQAADKNIPVVGWGIGDPAGFISIDADWNAAGKTMAEYLVDKLGDQATIGIIGNSTNPTIKARSDEAMKVFKQYPGITVKYQEGKDFSAQTAQVATRALLSASPNMGGILGTFDDYAVGATQAVNATDSKAIVVGADGTSTALDEIRTGGPFKADIAAPHESASRFACETGAVMLKGGQPLGKQIFLSSKLIDPANLPEKGKTDLSPREVTVIQK